MDFADIHYKYPEAFKRYVNYAIIHSCKSTGVNLSSSDLLESFFDGQGLFPMCFSNETYKLWGYSIHNSGKNILYKETYKSRKEVKEAMFKKCFHTVQMRLEKNT